MESNNFLCSKGALKSLMKQAMAERDKILAEFQMFYNCDINIDFIVNKHCMGYSIAADLKINGEMCKSYEFCDLCFLDLNELMLKRILREKETTK